MPEMKHLLVANYVVSRLEKMLETLMSVIPAFKLSPNAPKGLCKTVSLLNSMQRNLLPRLTGVFNAVAL
jgi:hypothetical protein